MPVSPLSTFPSAPAGNFFSGIDYTDPDSVAKAAGQGASGLNQRGANLSKMGTDALAPVFARLMKLLSGDEGAVSEATRSQTKGVIDQYDTARKAISQFSPRGGGRESALATSRFSEASDIASLKSNAISSATKELEGLGTSLLNAGENEQAQSLNTLLGLIQSAQQSKASTQSLWGSIGETAGSLLTDAFLL